MKIGEKGIVSFYLQQSVDDNPVRWFGHSMTRGIQREERGDLLRGISGWLVLVMPGSECALLVDV